MLKIENIMRVADMGCNQISVETLKWLQENGEITYKDQMSKEDLYNISGTIELIDEDEEKCPANIREELYKINVLLNRKDCGYLRITY